VTEMTLAYDRPSRLAAAGADGQLLALGQSAGPQAAVLPFFDGWLARPGLAAGLLLAVAAVARSRYFRPGSGRLLDPILTSGDGRLRLESFSSCCGVYARADLLPEALRDVRVDPGTTNVDLNQEVRDALARVDDRDEMRLCLGTDGMAVVTRETAAFERKVALPTRWIRGLGEAALTQVGMEPWARVEAAAARRFLAALPPAGNPASSPYSVVLRGRELRLRQPAIADAPSVAGPYRLRELRPLARYVESLTVWTRPGGGDRASGWQLDLPGARMWLVLSPHVARGFSGEGQALGSLADPAAVEAAAELRGELAWSARIDEAGLAARAGLPVERLRDLLAVLGSQGLVGRDAAERAWFRRDLPFAVERIKTLQPRVRRAAAIGPGDVTVHVVERGYEVFVRSGEIEHRVQLAGDDARCTCLWYSRHSGSRGPCRHVLAARRHLPEQVSALPGQPLEEPEQVSALPGRARDEEAGS
jgi:hypothetical protein